MACVSHLIICIIIDQSPPQADLRKPLPESIEEVLVPVEDSEDEYSGSEESGDEAPRKPIVKCYGIIGSRVSVTIGKCYR